MFDTTLIKIYLIVYLIWERWQEELRLVQASDLEQIESLFLNPLSIPLSLAKWFLDNVENQFFVYLWSPSYNHITAKFKVALGVFQCFFLLWKRVLKHNKYVEIKQFFKVGIQQNGFFYRYLVNQVSHYHCRRSAPSRCSHFCLHNEVCVLSSILSHFLAFQPLGYLLFW